MKYPVGVLVEYDGWVYRVTTNNTIIPLHSWNAVLSWGQPILKAEYYQIADYTISPKKLGFRPGTVLRVSGGDRYFIDGVKRRKLTDEEFEELGFHDFETLIVSEKELEFHKEVELVG